MTVLSPDLEQEEITLEEAVAELREKLDSEHPATVMTDEFMLELEPIDVDARMQKASEVVELWGISPFGKSLKPKPIGIWSPNFQGVSD